MQNKRSKGIRSFFKGKGYYIALLLCAAAVGISGYFLLKDSPAAPEEPSSDTTGPSSSAATDAPTEASRVTEAVATEEAQATREEPTAPTETQLFLRPVEGEILYGFAREHLAYNETTRDWRTHEAIDYSAPVGSPVLAAADGTVHTVYEDENFGMTVVVQHSGGYSTHYGNLAPEVEVHVGQQVAAGTVLGKVGETACSETAAASHLHFAVFANNVPIDPELIFGG